VATAVALLGREQIDVRNDLTGVLLLLGAGVVCGFAAVLPHRRFYQWVPGLLLVVFSVPATAFLILFEPS
jgi:hypothetical protein